MDPARPAVTPTRLAAALCAALVVGRGGPADAQDHGPVAPSGSLAFRCQFDRGDERKQLETTIPLPSLVDAHDLDQVVVLPRPLPRVRLVRYLPLAVMEQRVIDAPPGEGAPAVRLSIEGPKRSFERCLVVRNPVRDRMSSLIANWRLFEVEDGAPRDALFARFEDEMERAPTITVEGPGGAVAVVPAEPGLERDLGSLGGSIRVIEFYPHFSRDPQTTAPINLSERRMNPAVHLELRRGERSEERWAFTRFPQFRLHRTETLPYSISLDSPVEADDPIPVFGVMAVGGERLEVWTRDAAGEASSREVDVGEAVAVPDSNYVFRISEFEPNGLLQERYSPTDARRAGVTALRIRLEPEGGEPVTAWLAMGTEQSVKTGAGPIVLSFDSTRRRTDAGGGGFHGRGH